MLTLAKLTCLVLELNAQIDAGRHAGITLRDAHDAVEGDMFATLKRWFGDGIDLGVWAMAPDAAAEVQEALRRLVDGYAGDERRKFGIANNGVCLLVALVNQLVQQRAWREYPVTAAAGSPTG